MTEDPYRYKVNSTKHFVFEMARRGFSGEEIERLVSGVRSWARSDKANHDYAYPSLFISRLRHIYWDTFRVEHAFIIEWYAHD